MKNTYLGVNVKKARPTRGHRPAVWECMLGTVYALNDKREVRYFDYDHKAALAFAGVDRPDADLRLHRIGQYDPVYSWADNGDSPRRGKLVLWVRKNSNKEK